MKSPQIQLVTQLTYIQNEFERHMREHMASAGIKITRVRFGILYQIKETGSLNQQELADWNNITPQAVHRHMKFLQKQGYLTRTEHADDRRSYNITLTSSGKKLINDSEQILVMAVKDFFGDLSEKEVQTITKLLLKVRTFNTEKYNK